MKQQSRSDCIKTGGVYLGFDTSEREKVSVWELSDDSCSAFVRTQLVGETQSFATGFQTGTVWKM